MADKRSLDRRTFLKGAGIAGILAAGGLTWRAYDQGVFSAGEGPAYEPWIDWHTEDLSDPLNFIRAAILAANPHDTQPWKFMATSGHIDVYADPGRNIGSMDLFRREMYVGLGCALENLLIAAEAGGYTGKLTLMPDADSSHVASIDLIKSIPHRSALYDAIPVRHTNRGPYDKTKAIEPGSLGALQALNGESDISVFWFTSDADRSRIGDTIIKATEAIIGDREEDADSGKWDRNTWQDIQTYRDGITTDTSGLPEYMIILSKMLPAQSHEQNDQYWLSSTRDNQVATASAYGIIAARDNRDNTMRLKGGRFYQRMHLSAVANGMAMQPMNQVLERAERESSLGIEPTFGDALLDILGKEWQALIQFRIGYPTTAPARSPRRGLEDVLI